MPKVMDTELLRKVSYDLAMDYSIADVAKRNDVGRQWIYNWRDTLFYHGLLGSAYLSDEILRAVYDKDIYTPRFTKTYGAVNAFENRKARQEARMYDSHQY